MKRPATIRALGAAALSVILINCMSENPATESGRERDLPGMNTTEPGKPNYRDPASSHDFQLLVEQKTEANRAALIALAARAKKSPALEKSSTTYTVGLLGDWVNADSGVNYMDDEDYINGSALSYRGPGQSTFAPVSTSNGAREITWWSGYKWRGVTQPTANGDTATGTRFLIQPYTVPSLPPARTDYAVFKMGDACPPNSYAFGRYFHNESTNGPNNNWSIGNAQWTQSYYSATTMEFCFVPKSSSGSAFWYGGSTNGVFANPWVSAVDSSYTTAFRRCSHHGVVLTDDEDDNNGNSWWFDSNMPSGYISRIQEFMFGGTNTQMFFTWCEPVPVGIGKKSAD